MGPDVLFFAYTGEKLKCPMIMIVEPKFQNNNGSGRHLNTCVLRWRSFFTMRDLIVSESGLKYNGSP